MNRRQYDPASQPGAKGRSSIGVLPDYLDECRAIVADEIRALVPPDSRHSGGLYDLMLDYPLREGKALRPALCIAASRALGGSVAGVIRSAAVLELYHNAFLIHDDVEDGSELRRKKKTLHQLYGVPIAVNVGDGMLALTLMPLLDNMRLIGMGRALRVLEEIAEMARESAEGQMMELNWIRRDQHIPDARSYARMVHKKSSWYTFLTPITVGAITAGAPPRLVEKLRRLATLIGFAFQVQDDVLNLIGSEDEYGKEIAGDLWEGKFTLMLIYALQRATAKDRAQALAILRKKRPCTAPVASAERVSRVLDEVSRRGELSRRGRGEIVAAMSEGQGSLSEKTVEDVRFLRELIHQHGAVDYAWSAADRRSRRALYTLEDVCAEVPASIHRDFLVEVVDYVATRMR